DPLEALRRDGVGQRLAEAGDLSGKGVSGSPLIARREPSAGVAAAWLLWHFGSRRRFVLDVWQDAGEVLFFAAQQFAEAPGGGLGPRRSKDRRAGGGEIPVLVHDGSPKEGLVGQPHARLPC